jgi:hypothetical protein
MHDMSGNVFSVIFVFFGGVFSAMFVVITALFLSLVEGVGRQALVVAGIISFSASYLLIFVVLEPEDFIYAPSTIAVIV